MTPAELKPLRNLMDYAGCTVVHCGDSIRIYGELGGEVSIPAAKATPESLVRRWHAFVRRREYDCAWSRIRPPVPGEVCRVCGDALTGPRVVGTLVAEFSYCSGKCAQNGWDKSIEEE